LCTSKTAHAPGVETGGGTGYFLQLSRGKALDQVARWLPFENNYLTEMCSGSEAGSYLRLCVSLSSRLESNKEEEKWLPGTHQGGGPVRLAGGCSGG